MSEGRNGKKGFRIIAVVLLTLGLGLAVWGLTGVSQVNYYAERAQMSSQDWLDHVTGRQTVEPLTQSDYKGTNLNASGRAKNRIIKLLEQVSPLERFTMSQRFLMIGAGGALALAGAVMLCVQGAWMLGAALGLCFLGAFLLWPLINLLVQALTGHAFHDLFIRNYYFLALIHSLLLALAVTAAAAVIGIAMRHFFTVARIPGGGLIQLILLGSAVFSPFIGAYGLRLVLPNLSGFLPCALALVIQLFGIVFLTVDDASWPEGAPERVIVGKLWQSPGLRAGLLIVFLRAFTDYGVPRLLGGGMITLPVLLYEQFSQGDTAITGMLALLCGLVTGGLFLLWLRPGKRRDFAFRRMQVAGENSLLLVQKIRGGLFCYLMTLLALLPLGGMVYFSIRLEDGYGVENYLRLWQEARPLGLRTLQMTVVCVAGAALLGIFVSALCLRRRSRWTVLLENLALYPAFLRSTALAVTLLLAFSRRPLLLSGGYFLLLLGEGMLILPLALHFSAAKGEIKVQAGLPMGGAVVRGACAGALLGGALMLNDLPGMALLDFQPQGVFTTAIYQEMMTGDDSLAAAMAVTLAAATGIVLILFLLLNGRRNPE